MAETVKEAVEAAREIAKERGAVELWTEDFVRRAAPIIAEHMRAYHKRQMVRRLREEEARLMESPLSIDCARHLALWATRIESEEP